MIRTIFLATLIFGISSVKAQKGCPTPFGIQNDIKRYHVAAGVGVTNLYGDIDKSGTFGRAFYVKGDYQIKKGLYVGVEGQYGTVEAMVSLTDNREVNNTYFGGGLMATFHPFEFFGGKGTSAQGKFVNMVADAFYVGVGMMGIISKYDVYHNPNMPGTYGPIESFKENGEPNFRNKSSLYTRPTVNAGFAFPINRRYSRSGSYWSVLVNGQFNYTNSDLLDGYTPRDGNMERIGTGNDMYSYYSVGARYSF